MKGRVLIVAGSDSGGGAGIQADIKTVTALGAYAATAITALTAQNTTGVHGVFPVDVAFIAQQMELVLDDIGADAIKTGMLHNAEVIEIVVATLERRAPLTPVVVDPVMVAKGGASLLDTSATETMKRRLLPRAAVLTPNIPEAEALVGGEIASVEDMKEAAAALLKMGPRAVLLKGGHRDGDMVTDILAREIEGETRIESFRSRRIDTRHTHGTGCTLASAIAAGIAHDLDLASAVRRARAYVLQALKTAPGYGAGHGPLNHGHTVKPFKG
ncbi:MAG TPA: bifunctional hydroxymethylpyrimidine kinase/phosphomethylpyrimidine kinase [Alphaproteobacteria bacterium]|nr:bifunctional hydroxymethylpyrimidine kinase/phosphomethylpyrimidine kinase [Alphaproteobacteria bacterium]